MNFEALENFEWLNEPENVRFENDAMIIYAKKGSDFWQSIHRQFKKDDGHLFFCRQPGNFSLIVQWQFRNRGKFSQCGLMLRVDERNWFKTSLMSENEDEPLLVTSLTIGGHSDWNGFLLNQHVDSMWFKLIRQGDDYTLFYSLDGVRFVKVKTFYLKSYEEVKAGAYIASPNQDGFNAQLSVLQFDC